MIPRIRLVTFDALHTLLLPRLPIYVQYSQTFSPHLGVLDPGALKASFKTALKQLQRERPAYAKGANEWWGEVIRRTAVGAGADAAAVDRALPEIVPSLLERFSSREGYKLFPDALPTLHALRDAHPAVRTGLITNADARMRAVLASLDAAPLLDPLLVSEEEGAEKPATSIFERACARAGVEVREALHIGDELNADFWGARNAGMHALLLRRPGPEGEEAVKEPGEDLHGVEVIRGLDEVVQWVNRRNGVQ